MRIDGTDSFLSRLSGNTGLSFGNLDLRIDRAGGGIPEEKDILELSTDTLTAEEARAVKAMGVAFSKIDGTLRAMKKISVLAEDERYTEEERMDLQIRMIELQADLHRDVHTMGLAASGQTYESTLPTDAALSMFSEGTNKEEGTVGYFLSHKPGEFFLSEWGVASEFKDLRVVRVTLAEEHIRSDVVSHQITLVATGKGNVLESNADKAIKRLTEAKESGVSLRDMSEDPLFSSSKMFLGDAEASKKVTEAIGKEIARLADLREKTSASVGELLTPEGNASSTGKSAVAGLDRNMEDRYRIAGTELGDMVFTYGADLSDIRLKNTTGRLGMLFSAVDTFLKDETYRNLGIGKLHF
ncbi:hypothetical protein [Aminiphilus sp.]|jgi:hypothetical protein|uniref:hypothetical protein n=1 Tax=Aminiphilus sp. TaxID=1872488 RepID=UPI002609F6D1|nr:hypothetical protein [Aminiphilus sp.]